MCNTISSWIEGVMVEEEEEGVAAEEEMQTQVLGL